MLLQKINNKCGVTFIELVIVIFIIGIALVLAIPTFINMMEDVNTSERTHMTNQAEGIKDLETNVEKEDDQKL